MCLLSSRTKLNVGARDKWVIVFRYDVSAKKHKAAEGKVQAVIDNIKGKKHSIKSNEKESKVIDKEIAEMSKKLDEV